MHRCRVRQKYDCICTVMKDTLRCDPYLVCVLSVVHVKGLMTVQVTR